ncbi:MAG TPA: hypothetical protein VNF27_02175 [Candidatus Binataceae bacterium]|nr:hypothetical protein [Candidatus Binataceae bacterium]
MEAAAVRMARTSGGWTMKYGASLGLARLEGGSRIERAPAQEYSCCEHGFTEGVEMPRGLSREKKYLQSLENSQGRCYVALVLAWSIDRIFHFTKRIADVHNRAEFMNPGLRARELNCARALRRAVWACARERRG